MQIEPPLQKLSPAILPRAWNSVDLEGSSNWNQEFPPEDREKADENQKNM